MQVAFVHCRITPGGALSVFEDLISKELQKDEHIQGRVFTLFSDQKELIIDIGKLNIQHLLVHEGGKLNITTALPRRVNQGFLFCSTHKIPLLSWLFDYRNLMFFYPVLMRRLSRKIRKYKPKKIIISSFAIAKNITPVSGVKTTLYLHSPMQYIRSHYDEYKVKLTGIKGKLFRRIASKLRKRDLRYTKFDTIYANSAYTAELAKKLYDMNHITISYPPIDPAFFQAEIVETPLPYFVYVGRLVNFVRESDVIIKLFNKLGLPFIMMGSGPDELYLKSIAKENIMFIGRITDVQEKIKIMGQARGLINLTKESFGMGTAESLLLGVPVFGYADGATSSLVDENSGILATSKILPHLEKDFARFAQKEWNRRQIAVHARRQLGEK